MTTSLTQTPAGQATDLAELATMLDQIAALGRALGSFLLAPPKQQVLDQVRQPEMLEHWPAPQCADRDAGVAHLLASAAAGEDATEVRRDYNALFVGPERMKAPPYESVHLSKDRLVFEQQTFVVRAAYAQFGLAAPKMNQEPDDHMGLELEFLATLAVRALDCIDQIDELQQTGQDLTPGTAELNRVLSAMFSFLDQHVLRWGPEFFTLVTENATTEFYRGVGALGLGTLDHAAGSFGL